MKIPIYKSSLISIDLVSIKYGKQYGYLFLHVTCGVYPAK